MSDDPLNPGQQLPDEAAPQAHAEPPRDEAALTGAAGGPQTSTDDAFIPPETGRDLAMDQAPPADAIAEAASPS